MGHEHLLGILKNIHYIVYLLIRSLPIVHSDSDGGRTFSMNNFSGVISFNLILLSSTILSFVNYINFFRREKLYEFSIYWSINK